ncbi:hypothetical protein GCM10008013_03520 [Paenibacillus segetis]|uniref:Uncharacterized protein n=1 Tax=Paenibacillus segetis TaxID=1325360 RepID=A0ABQ1Y4A5_9BACL|nr:hypothetical protein GCM10008013_03520 [Paenibacillus segetis]
MEERYQICEIAIPVSKTFSDIGATVADNFDVTMPQFGQSLLQELTVS